MLRILFFSITFSLTLLIASCTTYQVTEKVYQAELNSASFTEVNK